MEVVLLTCGQSTVQHAPHAARYYVISWQNIYRLQHMNSHHRHHDTQHGLCIGGQSLQCCDAAHSLTCIWQ